MNYPEFTTSELESEIWKSIPDFEDRYEVSNLGRVRGVTAYKRYRCGRILNPKLRKVGYPSVCLRDASQRKHDKSVHRLVMLAFVGSDGRTVNHKNGIKTDNRLTNLEYVTFSENTRHAYATGLLVTPRGEKHWNSKLTSHDVAEIKSLRGQMTRRVIAERFGISIDHVSRIWRGVRRKDG
jgi:hypothetical protein